MAANTRDKIITAAIKLFETYGFSGTTTMAIAKEAKVSEMTIFRNFGNKENVFHEAVMEMTKMGDFQVLKEKMTGNLRTDLVLLGNIMAGFFQKNKNMIRMMMFESIKEPKIMELLADSPIKNQAILVKVLENKIQGDPVLTAEMFTSAIFGYVFGVSNFHGVSNVQEKDETVVTAKYIEALVDQLLNC